MTDVTTPAVLRALADRIETSGIDMDAAHELAAAYERHNPTGDGWTMRRDDAGFLARMNSVDAAVAETPAIHRPEITRHSWRAGVRWRVYLVGRRQMEVGIAPTLARAWHAANLRAMADACLEWSGKCLAAAGQTDLLRQVERARAELDFEAHADA